MKIKSILPLLLVVLLTSCSQSPEAYFNKTTLNTNLLSGFGSKDFEHIIAQLEINGIMANLEGDNWELQKSVEKHFTTYKIPEIEKDLAEIKELTSTEETKELLNRSIALYEYTLEKYKTDYIALAKLIDEGASKSDIEKRLVDLDSANLERYWELHESLTEVALPYAEKHGIEVSRY